MKENDPCSVKINGYSKFKKGMRIYEEEWLCKKISSIVSHSGDDHGRLISDYVCGDGGNGADAEWREPAGGSAG